MYEKTTNNFTCPGSYDVTVVKHFTAEASNSDGQLGLEANLEDETFKHLT